MVNNVAPGSFFTLPMKDDPQEALSKRLTKYEKVPLLNQCQAKIKEYKKQNAKGLYA